MNSLVNCPGCGFRARLPDGIPGLTTIICPQCKTAVPVDQLRPLASPDADASFPIWVDSSPGGQAAIRGVDSPLGSPRAPLPFPRAISSPPAVENYVGDYMKEEAERFAQYVATRLGDLHKRRMELAEGESRFEVTAMERKQDLHRQHGALMAQAERLQQRESEIREKETALETREAALAAREAEIAARESRVARAEARATDTDRRTAELRAAIDALEARRAAVAEDRAALDRRAESLDKAELALHRRSAELDELDERLRQEQEAWEREHMQESQQAG